MKAKAKRGRPSKYTDALAAEICERLSKGETLASICRDDRMPDPANVWRWRDSKPAFSQAIARARDLGFDAIADECVAIADATHRDTISTEHGDRPDAEWIARSRLRVDTRLKLLAKWSPKKYGERLELEQSGELDLVITIGGDKPNTGDC
jgi:hypothetical protein